MSLFKRQRGAVLIVSLIMLVILTLFVLSAVSLTSGTLKVVGNMQNQMVVESDAQAAIEQVLNVPSNFVIPVPIPVAARINYTNVIVRDRKSTRLNSSHIQKSRMPSSA